MTTTAILPDTDTLEQLDFELVCRGCWRPLYKRCGKPADYLVVTSCCGHQSPICAGCVKTAQTPEPIRIHCRCGRIHDSFAAAVAETHPDQAGRMNHTINDTRAAIA